MISIILLLNIAEAAPICRGPEDISSVVSRLDQYRKDEKWQAGMKLVSTLPCTLSCVSSVTEYELNELYQLAGLFTFIDGRRHQARQYFLQAVYAVEREEFKWGRISQGAAELYASVQSEVAATERVTITAGNPLVLDGLELYPGDTQAIRPGDAHQLFCGQVESEDLEEQRFPARMELQDIPGEKIIACGGNYDYIAPSGCGPLQRNGPMLLTASGATLAVGGGVVAAIVASSFRSAETGCLETDSGWTCPTEDARDTLMTARTRDYVALAVSGVGVGMAATGAALWVAPNISATSASARLGMSWSW